MFTHGINPTTSAPVDLLNRLVALRKDITTLSANPADATAQQGVNGFLGDLEVGENALLSVHTAIGARVKRLEAAVTRADALSDGLNKLVSKQEDIDMPKAILELANVEFSYKLSLQMGARIVQPTLLDFLS
jgi:flagellar hook-associated protein 3 FlgL